jgi:CBS domain-containing protein
MKVHEIMTAHARCVGPENTLVEAAGLMRELDVGALPVCEEERVTGIVTDRDMALRAIADGRDPNVTIVRDVMSAGVVHVFADQDVEEAARMMEERQIRRLPVLNREKRLVGMVSLGDIAISSNPAFSGMALRDVSEPRDPSARQRRLAERSASTRMPVVPGETRRPDARRGSAANERGSRGSTRKKSSRTTAGAASRRKSAARGRTKSSPRSRKSSARSAK